MASIFIDLPASTVAIPIGASTAARQDLEIADLDAIKISVASVDAKAPALGQALAASSIPVVMTAAQVTTLTPPAAITGFNLEATQALIKAKTDNIPALGQALAASSVPVVLTAAQIATLTPTAAITGFALDANIDALRVLNGAVTETVPATDTASSGLNGRLQRIAQRLTSLIALFPASLGAKAAAASLAVTSSTEDQASMGALTETAPATDTASSGHNGRLQRIAQRLTSLIALFPTALGQGTMATSMKVVLPSDQSAISVTPSARVASHVQSLTLDGTTAQTFNAPANAKWVKIAAGPDNSVNLKVAFGTTATSTVGHEFEPGRAEDFDAVANISIICKSTITAHAVFITWGV